MASTPGFEPGPHWWEASALTTAPPLLPCISPGIPLSVLQKTGYDTPQSAFVDDE